MDEDKVITGMDQEQDTQVEEKSFTQKEVDKIVEQRLARERKKFTNMLEGKDPRESAIEEREKNVLVKELQADAKDIFRQKNLPLEALELLNYTDKETCEKSIEVLEQVLKITGRDAVAAILKGGPPLQRAPQEEENVFRGVFGLN